MDELDEFLKSEPAPALVEPDPEDDPPPFDNPRPLRWAIPALALTLTSALLWQERADFAYLEAPSTPVDLGRPGDYRPERLHPGIFVRIEGQTGPEASHYRKAFVDREVLPLVDFPVIVDRPVWAPAANLPNRLPMPLRAEGQLEPDVHRPQLRSVIEYFLKHDQLAPPGPRVGTSHVWVLVEGQRPRSLGWNAAWCALLAALFVFNVVWLLRRLER